MARAMSDDPIEQLRERIRSTAAAADRLAAHATGPSNGGGASGAPDTDETAREAQALIALFHLLRDLLPPELRQQVVDLVRQVLLLLRAILDRVVASLEPVEPAAPPVVEDIPVD
jgi:hypothetical protein